MPAGTVIVGGGASGLAAAAFGRGALVLERLPAPGRKILATGGGRCNFTHDGAAEGIAAAFPGFGIIRSKGQIFRPDLLFRRLLQRSGNDLFGPYLLHRHRALSFLDREMRGSMTTISRSPRIMPFSGTTAVSPALRV